MRTRHYHLKHSALALAAAAALGPLAVLPASAATCTWITGAGNWAALANWAACIVGGGSPAGTPGAGDSATIGATGVVTVDTAQQIGTLGNAGQINIDAFLLTLAGGGSTTNTGTINVGGASTAALQMFHNVNNTGGVVNIGNGSVLNQFGSTFAGGVVNTTGSGAMSVQGFSAGNIVDGLTLNGTMNMNAAQVSQRVVSGLTLNGTVNVGSGSYLNFQGSQTLAGSGSIVLDAFTINRVNLDGAGSVLTIGSGSVIRGHSGTIGEQYWVGGGGQSIVNNGRIAADGFEGVINISGAPLINNGVVEATGGGTLRLSSNYTGNSGSSLNAGAGSRIEQNGVTLTGVVNVTGDFRPLGFSAANFLDGVTLNGDMNMAHAGVSQRVINGLTLNGNLNVGSGSYLNFQGSQALGGSGSIVLDSNSSNHISVDGTGSTLTIAAGASIRGHSGVIGEQFWVGGGGQGIVNNGTIAAEGAGGTIRLAVPLTGSGTLQVAGGTLMQSGSASSTQGRLLIGATGAFATSNQNLTITSDYTNVQAATGNSFNRRAGVTGTGQVLAGGDVSQAISGAAVTNGATTNATLTIGNVRVGANTFNYSIGNAATTGPTLRGAVQTAVNGGNITDARLTGAGVTAGNYNAGAPGGSSGPQSVVFTASSAGALAPLTGQALNLRSNFENIADQKLNIVLAGGAAAYNAAIGSAAPSPVAVANQRVSGTGSTALTVSNTAAAGAFSEDLRAAFGANGGAATNNSGVVSALVAGGSNSTALRVGVDTGSAGAKTGSVTLNYQTTGTVAGVSNGMGLAGANPPQVIVVSGNVYQAASGSLQTAPMNFGTIQVGQVRTQDLVVRNTASGAAGFVEDLHAAFGASGNSQISGAGTLNGILAGADSTGANGLMRVTVNAATVGALNSSIAVSYTSAGAVAGVSNGLGTLSAGSQDYGVSGLIEAVGTVISQASPLINTPTISLGAVRVGAASPTGAVSVTNVATVAPQAALNASIAPTSGPVFASGSFSLLDPGATNASSLVVGLNTGTAGNFTGAGAGKATISFVSDASNVGGCAPSCTLDLAPQVVNVEGKVYTQAVGALLSGAVNFGVVRVGDTVTARDITINNAAAVSALNDTLRGDLGGVTGPFGHSGSVAGIAAGASANLSVSLSTASAGVFSQTGTLGFKSQNADMADISAGADASVSVFAQVNNLANGDFDLLSGSGALTQSGSDYVLDLGTLVLGSSVSSLLQMDNEVSGPADELSGLFDLFGADDFGYGGWNPLSLLAAGEGGGAMSVNWLAGALGSYADTIVFNGRGTNASDSSGLAQTRRLTIRATVVDGGGGTVPVPGTLSLLLAAAAAGWLTRRRGAPVQAAARGVSG